MLCSIGPFLRPKGGLGLGRSLVRFRRVLWFGRVDPRGYQKGLQPGISRVGGEAEFPAGSGQGVTTCALGYGLREESRDDEGVAEGRTNKSEAGRLLSKRGQGLTAWGRSQLAAWLGYEAHATRCRNRAQCSCELVGGGEASGHTSEEAGRLIDLRLRSWDWVQIWARPDEGISPHETSGIWCYPLNPGGPIWMNCDIGSTLVFLSGSWHCDCETWMVDCVLDNWQLRGSAEETW